VWKSEERGRASSLRARIHSINRMGQNPRKLRPIANRVSCCSERGELHQTGCCPTQSRWAGRLEGFVGSRPRPRPAHESNRKRELRGKSLKRPDLHGEGQGSDFRPVVAMAIVSTGREFSSSSSSCKLGSIASPRALVVRAVVHLFHLRRSWRPAM